MVRFSVWNLFTCGKSKLSRCLVRKNILVIAFKMINFPFWTIPLAMVIGLKWNFESIASNFECNQFESDLTMFIWSSLIWWNSYVLRCEWIYRYLFYWMPMFWLLTVLLCFHICKQKKSPEFRQFETFEIRFSTFNDCFHRVYLLYFSKKEIDGNLIDFLQAKNSMVFIYFTAWNKWKPLIFPLAIEKTRKSEDFN